jgi:hypothetical protein
MLVLRDRTRLWCVGRVAVKNSRHVRPTQPVRRLREVWDFTSRWLDLDAGELPPCAP